MARGPAETEEDAVHVGQHAIVDRAGDVAGYELLFRASAAATSARVDDPDAATAQVLVATFLDFGLAELVGDRLAFLNLPRSFLVGSRPLPFGPEQVVLEVLEDVEADPEVLTGLDRLRTEGYSIALDDVTPGHDLDALLPLADYVKVDLAATPSGQLSPLVDRLAGPGRRLLAEKVETLSQLDHCRRLGFELFQGYLFARPRTLSSGNDLDATQLGRLRLISALSRPDVGVEEVLSAVQADPALCLQVLRASNSVATGLTRRVESVERAVLLLGRRRLQGWAMLMSLGGPGSEVPLTLALTRARMCQLLATRDATGANPSAAFLVGMLSGLAAPLGVPPADLAGRLPLAPEVESALVSGSGPLGAVLARVLDWEEQRDGDDGLRLETTRRAYLSALVWSRQACETLRAA